LGDKKNERTKQKHHCVVGKEDKGERRRDSPTSCTNGGRKPHKEVVFSLTREKEELLSLK
jgi:hypothetical protein